MAFTNTLRKRTVQGDQRVEQWLVTADAASGSVATGLQYIDSISIAFVSAATAGFKTKANLSEASATANGTVFVSSCASGDVFFVTVYGR